MTDSGVRCLGWMCNWRLHCQTWVGSGEPFVHIRWFQPPYTADACDKYAPTKETKHENPYPPG